MNAEIRNTMCNRQESVAREIAKSKDTLAKLYLAQVTRSQPNQGAYSAEQIRLMGLTAEMTQLQKLLKADAARKPFVGGLPFGLSFLVNPARG